MRVLFLSSSMGPAEAAIFERLLAEGHLVDVLSLSYKRWLSCTTGVSQPKPPEWVTSLLLQESGNQIASYFDEVVARGRYDIAIASGLLAGGMSAKHFTIPIIPLLWRGDLDFSTAKLELAERFRHLTERCRALFLEDDYEFDKALSKGSQSAHLLHPPLSFKGCTPLLADDWHEPKVIVLHPERWDEESVRSYLTLLRDWVIAANGSCIPVSSDSLFRARDLERGRKFAPTAQTRLQGATHIVLVGSSAHASSIIQYLMDTGQGDRIIAEDTVGMSRQGGRSTTVPRARTGALVGLLGRMLDFDDRECGTADQNTPADLLGALFRALDETIPVDHEELEVFSSNGRFNVFFSTSGLEDRTDGARPQRIRNMFEAVSRDAPTVRMNSNLNTILRRRRAVSMLLHQGRRPGLLYGENSTSPIPDATSLAQTADLYREWRRSGGTSAWFVRDLHWLDPGWTPAVGQEDISVRGIAELNEIGNETDVLLAPSVASVTGFQGLLSGIPSPSTPWAALPPGVAHENIGEQERSTDFTRMGTTVLYAGGIGSIYAMSDYLSAIQSLVDKGFFFDFVVRRTEKGELLEQLAQRSLLDHPNIAFFEESLDKYVSRTETTIGAVLLDGEYARFAFPYKTMSMLEKGFPVVVYDDMAIAEFVTSRGIGATTARNSTAIESTLTAMEAIDYRGPIADAQNRESWDSRVQQLRRSLRNLESI